MSSIVEQLTQKGLVSPPAFVVSNTMYETVMGSQAYGVAVENSDFDTCGFCIPPKEMLFPHLRGDIPDFGRQIQRFGVYQQHHVFDRDALGGKGRSYDLNIYGIVKFFQLCMECNPNMVDTLFTSQECVLHCTKIGNMVRDDRKLFLHKGAWHKYKGYAYSQLHEMRSKNPEPGSKRAMLREQFGFDVKFAYHVVRLLDEAEQILTIGDIDLRRNAEHLKAIRRGEVSQADIEKWAAEKEHALEKAYEESTLPYAPDEKRIKALLLSCLEEHYGNLDKAVVNLDAGTIALSEIGEIIDRYRRAA
jgi:predicted nucleotidyltransferase